MILALKAETESEGASWDYLRSLRSLSVQQQLPMYLKVGGVEAKTDMRLAEELQIDGVIAPMVESPFGVEKFASASRDYMFSWRGLTLETKTAYSQIDSILRAAAELGINGVTIGRGDLAASLGLRSQEDSSQIMDITLDICKRAKELGLFVTMGGKLNPGSITAARKHLVPLDAVETRRYVISYDGETNEVFANLSDSLNKEMQQETTLARNLESQRQKSEERIRELTRRLAME